MLSHSTLLKVCILIFAMLSSFPADAQWNQLRDAISPYSGPNSCHISLTIPYFIMPVGDGKILYASNCQISASSGGEMYIQYSKNDMSSMTIMATFSGMGHWILNNTSCANDTNFSFIYGSDESGTAEFTSNNFASSAIVSALIGNHGNGAGTAITTNYVYSIFRNPTDTMIVFRRNKAVSSVTTKQSRTFIYSVISDRLQFINDSTGFTIAAFKSNLSKMTLLKTTDYGVTWQPTLIDSIDPIVDHHALSANRMYLCKKSGAVYTSTNSGLSWTLQSFAPPGAYTAIRFCSDTVGYIGGDGGILYKSTNYGATWAREKSNTVQQINRIFTFGNVAYFVDAALKVFKELGKTDPFQIYPNPVSSTLYISEKGVEAKDRDIEIFNTLGQVVLKGRFKNEIDVRQLPTGYYILKIYSGESVPHYNFIKE